MRCQDPTEMDTFVSALICEVCEEDFLLPTEPLGTMHKQRHVYFFKMRVHINL